MDYGKSGYPRQGKNSPRHFEHNAKGSQVNPFGDTGSKADLLARMKAAAEAQKTEKPTAEKSTTETPKAKGNKRP